jgi:hypothetical protein
MGRRFSITVRGRLSAQFSSAFDEVRLHYAGSDTVISGYAGDQTYLDGILAHLRDLSLEVTELRTEAIRSSQARDDSPFPTALRRTRR